MPFDFTVRPPGAFEKTGNLGKMLSCGLRYGVPGR
jgi:hypothetical protein